MSKSVPFTEAVVARIRGAATNGELTTVAARDALRYGEQRWLRLTKYEGYPKPERRGRIYVLDVEAFVGFLALRNYVETGITLTQWARLTQHARKYVAARIRARRAPGAIGYVRSAERFDREAALAWAKADRRHEVQHFPPRMGPPPVPPEFLEFASPRKSAVAHPVRIVATPRAGRTKVFRGRALKRLLGDAEKKNK